MFQRRSRHWVWWRKGPLGSSDHVTDETIQRRPTRVSGEIGAGRGARISDRFSVTTSSRGSAQSHAERSARSLGDGRRPSAGLGRRSLIRLACLRPAVPPPPEWLPASCRSAPWPSPVARRFACPTARSARPSHFHPSTHPFIAGPAHIAKNGCAGQPRRGTSFRRTGAGTFLTNSSAKVCSPWAHAGFERATV